MLSYIQITDNFLRESTLEYHSQDSKNIKIVQLFTSHLSDDSFKPSSSTADVAAFKFQD